MDIHHLKGYLFRMEKRFIGISLALLLGCLLLPVVAMAETTYRWLSESDEWIYGPTPPDDPDQPYDVLIDGIMVESFDGAERNTAPVIEGPKALYTPEERQRQSDALLVLQYKTIDDIEEALNVELGHLKYEFDVINSSLNSSRNSLFSQINAAANRQRAGLEIEEESLAQINSIRDRMMNIASEQQVLKQREQGLRESYAKKRLRYQELLDRQGS